MRNLSRAVILAGFVMVIGAPLANAHHSEGPATRGKEPIVWQGTIAGLSWDGAHVMYLVDVPKAAGVVQSWQVLGGSPYRLRARGISSRTLQAGQSVTIAGYLNPLNRIITPVYLAPPGGPKFYVGYVGSDAAFNPPAAAVLHQ